MTPSIITITFNPALDKSVTVEALVPEKKLKCTSPIYEPGGGGINVARAIRKLGGSAVACFLAGGDAGKEIGRLLADEQVGTMVTEIGGRTRENLVVFESSVQVQYLFDMPGPKITVEEISAFLQRIELVPGVKFIVASGSLPESVPADVFARIARIAKRKGAKLIVDTSGEALSLALEEGVYLIKPNLRELALLVGEETLEPEHAVDFARELIDSGGSEAIVVSMGSLGALMVTKTDVLRITPPGLNIKSTVGAGDSLVAGIVLSLDQGKSIEEAVQYGVACGSAATLNPGTQLCSKADADDIFEVIQKKADVKRLTV
ncbi:1-phosphofructokinase family hexose kinase [Mucilaginibacter sp.]|uniref:1-phosphofructokinase family hexose kinase n=1 Tax=Mucilaginibacter sp. TaxID=1882438 RepID=UPI00283C5676|nr:1-phosphofructokinase family hexose kinase [Mucilaginibacter sp.]MDR3693644.1 1-phosphofructokinase family hexose kinase [Mucilaginibacter sp.]